MTRFLKLLLCLAVLLLGLTCASALAEASLTFSPEAPRVGDYVDVTVTPGREGALGVRYELSVPDGIVYKPKDKDKAKATTTHYAASFRPREEAVYTLTATVVYGTNDYETVSATIPVSGTAPKQKGPDVIYSQKDYWWHKTPYKKSSSSGTLENAGCAIFTLSHILQRLGNTGDGLQPDILAAKNARFFVQGGTDNGSLIRQAAADYGFVTEDELITTEREAITCLRRGDLFSFGIVLGHIAMADGVSEDGTLIHVVDSAPGATFPRKDDKRIRLQGHIYYQKEDGSFIEALSADELPGIRWFFESGEYGGMEYWLDLNYALHYNKHAGMRLIRRPWLQADMGSGLQSVSPEYVGTMVSKISTGGESESVRVPSKDLTWTTDGADGPQIAVVTNKKGAKLLDGDGKTLESFTKPRLVGSMFAVLSVDDDLVYVYWNGAFCWLSRKNVDLLPVVQDAFATAVVSKNGKTTGSAKVTVVSSPDKKPSKVTEWPVGTPVTIVETGKNYTLAEGKGYRGWIPNENLTPDPAE